MNLKYILPTFCLFLLIKSSTAQVIPKDKDNLNYTEILFQFPAIHAANSYKIEYSEANFPLKKTEINSEVNLIISDKFEFGKAYKWRYLGLDKNEKVISTSPEFQFSIATSVRIQPDRFQYRVIKNDKNAIQNGYIFLDYAHVAVNRTGKPVWFLPDIPLISQNNVVRNLILTPQNTLLAQIDSNAVELDLKGNILWQAPHTGMVSKERQEFYHHDFKKLENGNYMALGDCHRKFKIPSQKDSVIVNYGTIIEYSPDKKIVWSWNSADYFTDKDLKIAKNRGGFLSASTHSNAFSTDGKYVYVGFRDIHKILKIEKSTKKVVAAYGGDFGGEPLHSAKGFFRFQHDAVLLKNGNLAVINNDSIADPKVVSSLVVFSQIDKTHPISEKAFEFKFNFDSLATGKSEKTGNLTEFSSGNYLINMGSLNRIVEIDKTGKVLWDMFCEQKQLVKKITWLPFSQYRASFSSSLYPYIFSAEILEKVKKDITAAPVSNKMKTLLTIASMVRESGKAVTKEAIEKAKVEGATDIEIHDTVLIAALFCLYNRYVDGLSTVTPTDPAFYKGLGERLKNNGYNRLQQGYDHLKNKTALQ